MSRTSNMTPAERLAVLDHIYGYLAAIHSGHKTSADPAHAAILAEFFPLFSALVLDGATLSPPPTGWRDLEGNRRG